MFSYCWRIIQNFRVGADHLRMSRAKRSGGEQSLNNIMLCICVVHDAFDQQNALLRQLPPTSGGINQNKYS